MWTDVHTVRVRCETLSPIEITWLDEHLDDQMWYLPMHSQKDMAPLEIVTLGP